MPIDCGSQIGKVQGEYNFAYLNSQDCRKLMKKKVEVRPTGFTAAETKGTRSSGDPPWATGGIFSCGERVDQTGAKWYRSPGRCGDWTKRCARCGYAR
eukprot:293795-Amphidinium_carterae.1